MADPASSSVPQSGRARAPRCSEPGDKRPRTAYLLHRRYRLLSRLAATVGGGVGLALVAYSLGPPLIAGAPVPMASFILGAAIIATLAIIPYLAVRWRWRLVKASLDDV